MHSAASDYTYVCWWQSGHRVVLQISVRSRKMTIRKLCYPENAVACFAMECDRIGWQVA